MNIKYDISSIGQMSLFEKMTHAQLKDCYDDKVLNCITFIVQPGQLGKALGKGAVNAKRLQESLNRKIRIVEFHPDLLDFIRSMIAPLKADSIGQESDGTVMIKSYDTQVKGLLIGRNGANLRNLESNVRRHFEVKEIKVI